MVLAGFIIVVLLLYFFGFCIFNAIHSEVVANNSDTIQMASNDLMYIHENNSTVAAYIAFMNVVINNKMNLKYNLHEALLNPTNATEVMLEEAAFRKFA